MTAAERDHDPTQLLDPLGVRARQRVGQVPSIEAGRLGGSNRCATVLVASSIVALAACADIIGADFGSFEVRGPGERDAATDTATSATTGGRTTIGSGGGGVASGGSGGALGSSGGLSGSGGSLGSGGSSGSGGGATAGSGGEPTMGGAAGTGGTGEEAGVPQPRCCVDADCPASVPFCSPWGTCYQGGDPYNCDYDSFCKSFCVHCSGNVAGACEEKRCVCS